MTIFGAYVDYKGTTETRTNVLDSLLDFKKWLQSLETNQIPDCQKRQRYLRVQKTELRKPHPQRTIQFTGHNFAIGGSKK